MRMRSFTAASLPEAMQQVRRTLGDEAVILATQELGEHGVKITAAIDDGGPAAAASQSPSDPHHCTALVATISAALDFHRVPLPLSDELLATAGQLIAEDATMLLAGALDHELRFSSLPGTGDQGGRILLMGPPGAGKTATAAKLSALRRLAEKPTTLVTMDTESAGALEQVGVYAQALGIDVLEAPDLGSLEKAVGGVPADHLVVIDTVGVNPFDESERRFIVQARRQCDAEGLLVLPAGGDAIESGEMAEAFAASGARHLIASRVDTARRHGGILTAASEGRLSLLAVGISPAIGSGLSAINPVALARLLLPQNPDCQQTNVGNLP